MVVRGGRTPLGLAREKSAEDNEEQTESRGLIYGLLLQSGGLGSRPQIQ